MIITNHAAQRFAERFPELDIKQEFLNAMRSGGRVGRKTKAAIRRQCPDHKHLSGTNFHGYYYRMSRKGVVFVVTPPQTIVTVFPIVGKMSEVAG